MANQNNNNSSIPARKLSRRSRKNNRSKLSQKNAGNFLLFDQTFATKIEFFDNLTLYYKPIYGTVNVKTTFNSVRIKNFVDQIVISLRKSMTDDRLYRAIKNEFGIQAKSNKLETMRQVSNAVSDAILCLMHVHRAQKNVQLYYHNLGISGFKLPVFVYNLLSTLSTLHKVARLPKVPNSMITFSQSIYSDSDLLSIYGKDRLKEEKVYESIFRLEAFSNHLCPASQVIIINDLTKFYEAPRTFMSADCIIETEGKNGEVKDLSTKFKLGKGATPEAMFNAYLLRLEVDFSGLDVDPSAFDYKHVEVETSIMRQAINSYAIKTYGSSEFIPIVKLAVETTAEIYQEQEA